VICLQERRYRMAAHLSPAAVRGLRPFPWGMRTACAVHRVARVVVRGRRARVVGRICMDYAMIDVTDHAEVSAVIW
jgi:hypothetical protein